MATMSGGSVKEPNSWSKWAKGLGLKGSSGNMEENLEIEKPSSSKPGDTVKLQKADMDLYGHFPASDNFYLVVCNLCNQVTKPQAFRAHLEHRHAQAISGEAGNTPNGAVGSSPTKAKLVRVQASSVRHPSTAVTSFSSSQLNASNEASPQRSAPVSTPMTTGLLSGPGPGTSGAAKRSSKPPPASTAKKRFLPCKDREYDPNKHCGVLLPDSKKPCTRSLTCKTHSLGLRRAVPGRRMTFDELLAEHRAQKESTAKPSPVKAIVPAENTIVHSAPAVANIITSSSASPLQQNSTPLSALPPEPPPGKVCIPPLNRSIPPNSSLLVPSSNSNSSAIVTNSSNVNSSNKSIIPPVILDSPCVRVEASSDPFAPLHPIPAAVCSYDMRQYSSGLYALDRRWSATRSRLESLVNPSSNSATALLHSNNNNSYFSSHAALLNKSSTSSNSLLIHHNSNAANATAATIYPRNGTIPMSVVLQATDVGRPSTSSTQPQHHQHIVPHLVNIVSSSAGVADPVRTGLTPVKTASKRSKKARSTSAAKSPQITVTSEVPLSSVVGNTGATAYTAFTVGDSFGALSRFQTSNSTATTTIVTHQGVSGISPSAVINNNGVNSIVVAPGTSVLHQQLKDGNMMGSPHTVTVSRPIDGSKQQQQHTAFLPNNIVASGATNASSSQHQQYYHNAAFVNNTNNSVSLVNNNSIVNNVSSANSNNNINNSNEGSSSSVTVPTTTIQATLQFKPHQQLQLRAGRDGSGQPINGLVLQSIKPAVLSGHNGGLTLHLQPAAACSDSSSAISTAPNNRLNAVIKQQQQQQPVARLQLTPAGHTSGGHQQFHLVQHQPNSTAGSQQVTQLKFLSSLLDDSRQ